MIRLAIVVTGLLALPAAAQTITDGDTIKLNGRSTDYFGINSPELRQTCLDGRPAGRLLRPMSTPSARQMESALPHLDALRATG